MKKGSLSIVGTGYQIASQVTLEAANEMRNCDKLFHLVTDYAMALWLESLNPSAEDLKDSYVDGRRRRETYAEIVERILAPVRQGARVCAAFYGHPGIFVLPGHEALRRARSEGYEARMFPGISALDCLFADLGVDPAEGCQIFEATDFLLRRRPFAASGALILLQIASIATVTSRRGAPPNAEGLRVLAEVLGPHYPPGHQAIVYQASPFPVCEPTIERVALQDLPRAAISAASTLYVPPTRRPPVERAMADRLGYPRH